ncbi:sulfate permease [Ectothiorhodospiraceae bacterium 2226]|nr:sulfate permease [Ectothiorhodospiraceae bacterium 2226]
MSDRTTKLSAPWSKLFPFLRWFPLGPGALRTDGLAGLTVALVLIPQSMAYAQLAGLPVVYGLYASFVPVIVAALWGSCPQLHTGPVAMLSLMTAAALAPLAAAGTDAYIALALLLALLVGVFRLAMGLLRAGFLVSLLSSPVIAGFTNAAALIIALSQLNKVFNLPLEQSGVFLRDILQLLLQIADAHWPTLVVAGAAFLLLVGLKRWAPRVPGVLVTVVLATAVSALIGFERLGGQVVGQIPQGLPGLSLPALDPAAAAQLLPSAFVMALIGFLEAMSISRAIAARTRQKVNLNQELVGQGLANIAGSFFQSFAVSGSFSRSALNAAAGARTGLAAIFSALAVVLALLYLTPVLYHLPQAVLAVIVMQAVSGLIDVSSLRRAWRIQRQDAVAGLVTFVATLAFAPRLQDGILVGGGLALAFFVARTMRPRIAVLSRADDGQLRDAEVHRLPTSDRIMVLRMDRSLYFANASYFTQTVQAAVQARPALRYVLLVGDGMNEVDASGEEALRELARELQRKGVTLTLSSLKRPVYQTLRTSGLVTEIGEDRVFVDEEAALAAFAHRLGPDYDPAQCPLRPRAA